MHLFKKRFKTLLIMICICALVTIVSGVFFFFYNTNALHAFSKEFAYHMLENNPLELHYSIAHPEKWGYENIATNLIPFHENSYANGKIYWEEQADSLAKIDSTFLRKEDLFLYNLLDAHIQLQLESLEFPYYENPLSCTSGIHSQLPILLSEYTFRSKKDIENYFILLSQIPDYLNGLYTYAYKQDLNGICVYKGSLEEISAQCQALFSQDALNNETHFLQTSFVERMQALKAESALTQTEIDAYTKRNTALLNRLLAPAYKKLANDLSTLKGSDALLGLSAHPNGKSFYALLLRTITGSPRSVEEIQKMLYDRYDNLYESYKSLLAKNTFVQNFTFPFASHKEMVEHLYQASQRDFPSLSEATSDSKNEGVKQRVSLKNVHGVLTDMSAPAFYMTPPIDENSLHTIYINPSAKMKHIDLYTTLAHEGFPGHLYQTVYSQTALQNANVPLVRQLLYYGGFTEGWAVYSEFYAYQYATEVCGEQLADTLSIMRINRELQLCICSMLDIYIHYDGANLKQVKDLLSTLGLNTDHVENIYEIICDAPANYPKYYVGYLEILSLKEKAKKLWANNYSDYTFHKWILETGGGDYKNLEERLLGGN